MEEQGVSSERGTVWPEQSDGKEGVRTTEELGRPEHTELWLSLKSKGTSWTAFKLGSDTVGLGF